MTLSSIRSVRVGEVALADYVATILLAVFWASQTRIPLPVTTCGVLVFAVALHAALGVDTPTGRWLGIQ